MTAQSVRGGPRRYVLDANALTGLFEDRQGTAGKIERLLEASVRSRNPTVNVSRELG